MTVLCRTCCRNINTDEEIFALDTVLKESDNHESLNRVLKNLLPTVNLDLVHQPVVCNSCYVTVVNYHNFKRVCLKNEATVRNYIRNNQIKTKIQLAEIFSTICPPNKDDQQVVKIEEEEETVVKEEHEVVGGNADNEVENVDLKPDYDEVNVNYLHNQIKTEIHVTEIFPTNCWSDKDNNYALKIEKEEIIVGDEEPEVIGANVANDVENIELNLTDGSLDEKYEIQWRDRDKIAGNKCNYYQCGRSKRMEPSLRKFAFPINDKERYKTWLINSGNAHLLGVDPSEEATKMYICHHHFNKKYFLQKQLASTAIPEPYLAPMASEEEMQCVKCQQKFDTFNEIARHIKHAHGSIRCIVCKLCSKLFISEEAFQIHLAAHKTVKQKYACKRCKRKFDSLVLLQKHEVIHSKSISRSICKVKTSNSKALSRQRAKQANLTRKYNNECDYCGRKYSMYNNLLIHIKASHGICNKLEKNDVCGKIFETNGKLLSHKQVHKEN